MRSTLLTIVLAAVSTTALAPSAHAVTRRSVPPLLYQRTAVSGYLGKGLPVGEFSDERPGYGNHEEGAIDWAVELEHFAGRTASIGISFANTTYDDKTFADTLQTQVTTVSGFVRVVIPTGTGIRPYLRFGMGGVQLEFLDPLTREDSDWEFSLQAGGGLIWLPARWLGLSAQALYYNGDTDDSMVYSTPDEIVVVGFDTSYWAFSAGVSLFFP
jgi:opacity protein-like surface antigen